MSRFSEAMWFKKGEVEEGEGAPAASVTESDAPIEERYADDGSLTGDDLARYNLRTGRTEPVAALRARTPTAAPATTPALASGVLGGDARVLPFALAALGVILAIGVLARVLT